MEKKGIYQKYYSRLAKAGIIKALICGFIIGFAASIIPAVISFLVNYNGIWISIAVALAVGGGCAVLFYHVFFRPTTRQIAERIDRLGLDERLITMMELEKDESYIAMRQREDAKEKLSFINSQRLKLSIFKIPVIVLALLAASSITMMTVSALSVEPEIYWPVPPPHDLSPNENTYLSAIYTVDSGGYIDENDIQFVLLGDDALTVIAVAHTGFAFTKWSDGVMTAERTDKKLQQSIEVTALFGKLGDGGGGGEGGGGEYIGSDYKEKNVIHDNATHYREYYDVYYDEVLKILNSGGDIPDYMREFIELYFKNIA